MTQFICLTCFFSRILPVSDEESDLNQSFADFCEKKDEEAKKFVAIMHYYLLSNNFISGIV